MTSFVMKHDPDVNMPPTMSKFVQKGDVCISPLSSFDKAKRSISDLYEIIERLVAEFHTHLSGAAREAAAVSDDDLKHVQEIKETIRNIRKLINRDFMKLVFFGRTSSGKSSVINAMLEERVLPTGIGMTTNCFLEVAGTDHHEAYVLEGENKYPFNSKLITDKASAISRMRADSGTLIKIYWPKDRCELLKHDVILVDSPGTDIDHDFDQWIDNFCQDADVFVFVANAESTLMQTEKKFFRKVGERLSKPNVFILNNRWDLSDQEAPENKEKVKQQHMECCVYFLVDDLGVIEEARATDRVFFVSASEVLLSKDSKYQIPNIPGAPGGLNKEQLVRLVEFDTFKKKLEECISDKVLHTKFAKHIEKGKMIISKLETITEQLTSNCNEKQEEVIQQYNNIQECCNTLQRTIPEVASMNKQTEEHVIEKMEKVYKHQISKLSITVDRFNRQFSSDPEELIKYKNVLTDHVVGTLTEKLKDECYQQLAHALSEVKGILESRVIPSVSRILEMNYSLPNLKQISKRLCEEFEEDLQFYFWSSSSCTQEIRDVLEQIPLPQIVAASVLAVAASPITLIIVAIGCSIVGFFYLYKKSKWNDKAKEKAFKEQYVQFTSRELQRIKSQIIRNYRCQVKQGLEIHLRPVISEMKNTITHQQSKLQALRQEHNELDQIKSQTRPFGEKFGALNNELDSFMKEFLQPESRL